MGELLKGDVRVNTETLKGDGWTLTLSTEKTKAPALAALVYRQGKGCKQYAFETPEQLETWAKRHPYKKELVRVMPFAPTGKKLGDKWTPAAEAAEYVRTLISAHEGK